MPPDSNANPTAPRLTPTPLGVRYGAPPDTVPAHWNETLELLLNHRSVRAYLPDALPPGTLETLVATAQSASSSSNLQTWSVIAVTDPARKARLAAVASGQKHITQAPLFLVWLADLARLAGIAEQRGIAAEGLDYLELLIVGMVDAALAAQNAVVALESLGLGAVYIGALRNDIEKVAVDLALPPRVMPLFGLCVGYPDAAVKTDVKPRLPQDVVLHHEQYQSDHPGEHIEGYDAAMQDFQKMQGMALDIWSGKVIERVRTPGSLTGRHRMRESLARLGFPLR